MSYNRDRAAELVLALMQLTLHEGVRTWKSYDWEVMNDLFERGYITDPRSKAKSVVNSGLKVDRINGGKVDTFTRRGESLPR